MKEIREVLAWLLVVIILLSLIYIGICSFRGAARGVVIGTVVFWIAVTLIFPVLGTKTNEEYVEELRMKKQRKEEKARRKEEKRRQREIENSPTAAGKPFP